MDTDVHVWRDDVVEMSVLLIGKKQIRHPNPGCVRQGQVFDFTCATEHNHLSYLCWIISANSLSDRQEGKTK